MTVVERLRMLICERSGGHDFEPERYDGIWTDGETDYEVFTEACACGVGRILAFPLQEA